MLSPKNRRYRRQSRDGFVLLVLHRARQAERALDRLSPATRRTHHIDRRTTRACRLPRGRWPPRWSRPCTPAMSTIAPTRADATAAPSAMIARPDIKRMARDAVRTRLRHLAPLLEVAGGPDANQLRRRARSRRPSPAIAASGARARARRRRRQIRAARERARVVAASHRSDHAPAVCRPAPSPRAARYRAGTSRRCGTARW